MEDIKTMNNSEIVSLIEENRTEFSKRFLHNAKRWNVSGEVESETLDFGIYREPEYEPYLKASEGAWEHTGTVIKVKITELEFWLNNIKLMTFMEGKDD